MRDTAMTLPDGRLVAYTDLGPPDGPLVFYFHGAPTSRLDLAPIEEAFNAAGTRVVSPDRPGYGGSTAQRSRTLDDWPADVAVLADHLGAERFSVMGLSSGGPYVVACAAMLADRIASAAVIAGVTDMGWPGAWEGYDTDEPPIMRLGDEEAAVRWCEDRYGSDGSGYLGGYIELAPADQALYDDEATAAGLFATVAEAFRQGVGGYAQDVWVQGRPWSFDLTGVTAPVRVVHGAEDPVVPISHSRHTAEVVPGATLEVLPRHGHLSVINEMPRLASELAASLR